MCGPEGRVVSLPGCHPPGRLSAGQPGYPPGSAEWRGVLSCRELRFVAPVGDLRCSALCSHSSEDAQASEHVGLCPMPVASCLMVGTCNPSPPTLGGMDVAIQSDCAQPSWWAPTRAREWETTKSLRDPQNRRLPWRAEGSLTLTPRAAVAVFLVTEPLCTSQDATSP